MTSKIVDLVGKRFGRLTIVKLSSQKKGRALCWNCICDCGNKITKVGSDLKRSKNISCGCILKKEKGNEKACEHCNKLFISQHKFHKFCSSKCSESNRKNKTCKVCKKNYIYSEQGRRSLKYCSPECRIKDNIYFQKDGCWLCKKVSHRDGMSPISIAGKRVYLHRYFWEEKNGKIPDNMMLARNCKYKNCVNPAHMKLYDKKDFHKIRPPTNLSISEEAIKMIIDLHEKGYNLKEIHDIYRDKYKYRLQKT